MTHTSGVAIATVTGLADPAGEGRVQVQFEMLPGAPKSSWAAVAMPFAGKDRGTYFMPEVGDEALVAFQHGHLDHPFIVGFLWNGADVPPDKSIDEHVRRIRTTSGHEIDLDDREGEEAVTIRTQGGNVIEMSDDPGGLKISISTKKGKVEIVDDPMASITISVPTGDVKVACLRAQIDATATVSVSAPMTTFSGVVKAQAVMSDSVVQAQSVIANSVVSPMYTPGLGNIW